MGHDAGELDDDDDMASGRIQNNGEAPLELITREGQRELVYSATDLQKDMFMSN